MSDRMRATIFPTNFLNNWESELSTFTSPYPKVKNTGGDIDTRRIFPPLTRLKRDAKSQGSVIVECNSYRLTVWVVSAIYTVWETLDPIGSEGYSQQ